MSNTRHENNIENTQAAWWIAPISASFGGAAGAVAAYPFEGLKKSVQAGLIHHFSQAARLCLHPRELYRGTAAFSGSLIPTTIIQMTSKKYFDSLSLSPATKQVTDALCGALGALASTPAEKIILTQRTYKFGPIQAASYIVKNQGVLGLWNGLMPLAIRETVFGSCMLRFGRQAYNEYGFMGSLTVGFAGALISHPFDAIATKMQCLSLVNNTGTDQKRALTSMKDATKEIYTTHGTKGFYRGGAWRLGLFTTAMVTIPAAEKFISDKLQPIAKR